MGTCTCTVVGFHKYEYVNEYKPFPIMTNGFLAACSAATACFTATGSARKSGGAGHIGTNLK